MAEFESTFKIYAKCKHATEKAILVTFPDHSEEWEDSWIPQSQIDDSSEIWKKDDEGFLVISEWIAKQKGWVT